MLKNELRYLTLKLTNSCNLNCAMCGQVYSPDRGSREELSVKDVKRILDEAEEIKHVYLFGGEPLLYGEINELLEELKERKVTSHITTNGTLLERYAEKLVSCGVSSVEISMDSCDRDTLCKIRGRDVYDDIVKGINRLKQEKEKQKKQIPLININFVILPHNYRELEEFINHVKVSIEGVNHTFFQYPMLTNEEQGLMQERIYIEEFGVPCESWKWFNNTNQMFEDSEIQFIYEELKKLDVFVDVSYKRVHSEEELIKVFRGKGGDAEKICECPFTALAILPNGDAVFCPDFPDIKIGNIYHMSIKEIWNSKNSQIFREHLLSKGNYPICKSCYHIDEVFDENH